MMQPEPTPAGPTMALRQLRERHANEEAYLREAQARKLADFQARLADELAELRAAHAAELDELFTSLHDAANRLEAETSQLRERKRQWGVVEQRVEESLEKLSSSVIKLNVGGRIFAVPKETLLRFEGSYFHAMLSNERWKPDLDNDAYFIDADPTLFEYVMTYLREGDLSCEGLPPLKKQRLMKTLDYLNLEVLQWDAGASVDITDGTILLSEDKRTVSFSLSIADETGFIQATHPVDRVSIQIVSTGNTFQVTPQTHIGLEAFQPDGDVDAAISYNVCSGEVKNLDARMDKIKGQTFQSGDILTISYHRAERAMTFAKNGLDMGICIQDVPEKKYYPYIDTNCDGICLSLAS
ncbi:hypothetical protein SPRG_06444 [Saprolegnia parasitica CBS 223.65]|uniref:BTB domain-containing protein n=1 Tax=Saprolegnia parasitica (strain CBS 223.65) TaxID=695850 RepID=A0A067CDL5_SAPPC|nr:hypothetical protein SPRG_06444 [Saprolegnia parasitica CBS 223.65]KDO28588.1 hypothetical protein SPRG_06444 [Saprolegnia parasitica CBS 223.65]|eukprot:XP_012200651.1 hypothetical protein SPRG_06444 [Saprolegnia parasitica CBS 223.65]